ncbi:FG-GAP repeat domain-containing protein [Clostridium luticellarii]|jgi:hypothetical protein|uniref:FG-GAP repeat protein n=1 Tax=Clostridium luticellarii TaxID=1691940 RepID=A0A2T0BQA8_9CLOT|nr:VCBS repeat-containing protein [Clostridium luticellarii]MCI1944455.1 VCBS repeat-containing protein [Clostridium luticellarii]MCI1967954.1 VCBS repeat-containing protein [Clostridium luticellarii]MCI1995107.1 VCBS repeat-containing protein [Clostridium luticellarii]MCI2039266.1 VCBS repeat-containing protein [Clostridium luticellarii]PRR86046.1 hypothetical protein CLLU_08780 [Clostridium luticellarii]
MKFRVIFLSKRHIYFLLLLLLIIFLSIIFISSRSSSPSFNTISSSRKIKADLNGDGNNDILYIVRNGNNYLIKATIDSKTFNLSTSKNSPVIQSYSPYWPLRITLMDISRNKVPEIFIQGSVENKSVQRIFMYNGTDFKNIMSNSSNILGFMDCKNNKTPKIISGNLGKNSIYLSNYIFLNNKLKNYNYEYNSTFMGQDTIYSFVKLVEGLPESEPYKPKDIFSPNISKENLALIGNLTGENNSYLFQDGFFMENNYDKDGNVSEISWFLNFKGISRADKNMIKNYTLNLILTRDNSSTKNYLFKITSMYRSR